MVKKLITNLNSSTASDPDCILVMFLKNSGPEISYILAELFNMCLKESSIPDCWKASLVVPTGKRSTTKNYHSVSLLSVVSKVFEKLKKLGLLMNLEKCDLFSDFHYGFRPS